MANNFRLILSGPIDSQPETLRQLKGVLLSTFNLSAEEAKKALEELPYTLKEADSRDELLTLEEALSQNGGSAKIEATDAKEDDAFWLDDGEGLDANNVVESVKEDEALTLELSFAEDDDVVSELSADRTEADTKEKDKEDKSKKLEAVEDVDLTLSFAEEEETEAKEPEKVIKGEKADDAPSMPEKSVAQQSFSLSFADEEEAIAAEEDTREVAKDTVLDSKKQETNEVSFVFEEATEEESPKEDVSSKEEDSFTELEMTLGEEEPEPSVLDLTEEISEKSAKSEKEEETESALEEDEAREPSRLADLMKAKSSAEEKESSDETDDMTEEKAVDNAEDPEGEESKKKRPPYDLIGLIIVGVLALVYFNINQAGQKSSNNLSDETVQQVLSSVSKQNTGVKKQKKKKKKEPTPLPVTTFTGTNITDKYTVEWKLGRQGENIVSAALNGTTPEPPELSPEEIVSGKSKAPWLRKFNIAEFELKPLDIPGTFSGNAPAMLYLEYKEKRERISADAKLSVSSNNDENSEGELIITKNDLNIESSDDFYLEVNPDGEYEVKLVFEIKKAPKVDR